MPVVAALIFVIRCVAVARGDTSTANILIATTTVGDAIRALAFLVIQLGLVVLAMALLAAIGPRGKLDLTSAGLAAASLVSWIAGAYVSGDLGLFWFLLIPYAFLLLINVIRAATSGGRRGTSAFTIALFIAVAILFSGTWIVDDAFWLPRERLVFQSEAPFTGYVLKESGDYLVILKERPRVIIERKKDTLDTLNGRDFCHPRPSYEGEVPEKVQSNTPVCP